MTNALQVDRWGLWSERDGRKHEDTPCPEQVAIASAWLAEFLEPGGRWSRLVSYSFKHDVEDWCLRSGALHRGSRGRSAQRDAPRPYISNGAFIAAAIASGYEVRAVDPINVQIRARARKV